ncbi:MAG: thymidylate synthase [Nitrososphaerota archaeon]|nr:thymidylate synthase [Candidatus Bathyarchaeota archaeon]MCX8161704.1 thymidylate synthase [Candidatus Bathyarchaeota archaeon]MDW8062116.1 thymidylate synthase [Nitrososphaerota archaeon]
MRPPFTVVRGRCVAEVWETAVEVVYRSGVEIDTEYGCKARESTLMMIVEDPFSEPRIHPGDVYAVVGLKGYLDEVLEGRLDSKVAGGKLAYTYHERLFSYGSEGIDQIDYIVEKLRNTPYTRRAQAITWIPSKDLTIDSPPCLQRLWFKIYDGKLVLQSEWRSRDLFRAAHMNMLAMTELQKMVADKLGSKVGAYFDFSNSAHIYDKSYGDVERFLKTAYRRRDEKFKVDVFTI